MVIVTSFLTVIFTFGRAQGVMVFPFILVRSKADKENPFFINHERIHFQQALELLVVGFYLIYLLEFLFRLIQYRQVNRAYRNISFEREAYLHDHNLQYLQHRKLWSSFNHF